MERGYEQGIISNRELYPREDLSGIDLQDENNLEGRVRLLPFILGIGVSAAVIAGSIAAAHYACHYFLNK